MRASLLAVPGHARTLQLSSRSAGAPPAGAQVHALGLLLLRLEGRGRERRQGPRRHLGPRGSALEPKMMARKQAGFAGVLFLTVLSVLLYLTNKRIWKPIKYGKKD